MSVRARLRQFGARLARDTRGVAAVEFALILPPLLILYFGTVEASRLYTADRKVSSVAGTMADLVARAKQSISRTGEIDKYFAAAENIMLPYDTAVLRQSVSLLQIDSAGVASVTWSVGFNGGEERTAGTEFPLDAEARINLLARNGSGYLVVSEIEYDYNPLIGLVFQDPIELRHVEYFLPRYDARIDLAG